MPPTAANVDPIQALIMAVLQGVTELFPISSLGHAVLVPRLLGWPIDEGADSFLPFLVALHLGTATALLIYFWRDWLALLRSLFPSGEQPGAAEQRRLLWLLVIGTVPAGLVGLVLEKRLAQLFASAQIVAVFLALNGLLLLAGEWLRRRQRFGSLTQLTPWQALGIGFSQVLALLPGFSRSGATLVGGLLVGLTHEAAARFSFLLATPIIGAAALLELPKLLRPELRAELPIAAFGAVLAGVCAYLTTWFLMRYFKRTEINALIPFAVYCLVAGAASFFLVR